MNTPIQREPTKLSLHMDGAINLGGDVRLALFVEKLDALRLSLVESDHVVSGKSEVTVDFAVSGLSHNSPAMVEITVFPLRDSSPEPDAVVHFFLSAIASVRSKSAGVARVTKKLLLELKRLTDGVGESYSRLWLTDEHNNAVALDRELADEIKRLLPATRTAFGSIRGIVKRYTGVGHSPSFHMYLPPHATKVKCLFPPDLMEQAAAAVEKNATVEGVLRYHVGEARPFEVAVKSITPHKPDRELPTLTSLSGMAPGATGEMSAADFVRSLANGW